MKIKQIHYVQLADCQKSVDEEMYVTFYRYHFI